jgi:hypothetical protein
MLPVLSPSTGEGADDNHGDAHFADVTEDSSVGFLTFSRGPLTWT